MPEYSISKREQIRGIILEAYITGFTVLEILRYLKDKIGVEMTRPGVEFYVAEIKAEMREAARVSRQEQLGKAMARLERLFRKAMTEDKDHRLALLVQREINMLHGLLVQPGSEGRVKTLEDWLRDEDVPAPPQAVPGVLAAQLDGPGERLAQPVRQELVIEAGQAPGGPRTGPEAQTGTQAARGTEEAPGANGGAQAQEAPRAVDAELVGPDDLTEPWLAEREALARADTPSAEFEPEPHGVDGPTTVPDAPSPG